MYNILIDANVWIKYARAKEISPLINRFVSYNFLPIANNYLLGEIFDALVENKWMDQKQATSVIAFIKKVTFFVTERAVYGISPDPKDNYLFDLAVQNNCVFIISDDTKLLHFKLKPIPVHSTSWFIKKFPLE
ncbi:MAG: putative toxin-antitoxin system toxin component, PIN family [Bacteroidota bacterium]